MDLPVLRLNPKADYRLQRGHLWIYSNEVDNKFRALTSLRPGDCAVIEAANGKLLGVAYINPTSLICGRMINPLKTAALDANDLAQRIQTALQLRNQLFAVPCYRLIYGESDNLPGLVVDRFFDVLVVQISTAGMESYKDLIIASLEKIIQPRHILLKNDSKMRAVEGIPEYIKWVAGSELNQINLEENSVKFIAPMQDGQKTGWYYDHRMCRARLKDYVNGKRVLDMFSYIGGWGIQAAAFGASEVICSDVSEYALRGVKANAALNKLTNVTTLNGDAFEVMENLAKDQETFDVIILDPPAFIPRRKDVPIGTAAYQKINLLAARLLNPNSGILISCSCSMHFSAAELRDAIHKAGLKLKRNVQILEQGHQGPDHPIHPAIPETEYLKSFIARFN